MRILLKLAVAAAIVASTYYAIVRDRGGEGRRARGRGDFALDGSHPAERARSRRSCGQLRGWGEHELASSLERLQGSGQAPGRASPRRAGGAPST